MRGKGVNEVWLCGINGSTSLSWCPDFPLNVSFSFFIHFDGLNAEKIVTFLNVVFFSS